MAKSLIEELPRIASEGRQEAQRIIERLSSGTRIGLQTNELVLPRKDVSGFFRGQVPNIPNAFNAALDGGSWMNRLVYGDNLLTMQALLAGDPQTGLPSLRGKVDLIYIDPPFDSKADYRTPITLPNVSFSQRPTVIEQFAYADTWEEGTISYLKMIYPRLVLMKELLSLQETRDRLRASEKQLSRNIYERGVDDRGFGRIRSKGDTALFGGHTTEDMKLRLGIKSIRPLADFLPTLTIAAKNLATEMTNYNVEQKDLYGEPSITAEHIQNNVSVRQMLGRRGIKPENLPPAEDIKKVERRVASNEKKIEKTSSKLPKKVE